MERNRDFRCAKDMMSKSIIFIDGLATVKDAVELMRKENVDSLIVKKRNDQDAYGIVTTRDLVTSVIIPDRTAREVNVFEIMIKPTISIPANMDVRYVARLFVRFDGRPTRRDKPLRSFVAVRDTSFRGIASSFTSESQRPPSAGCSARAR